MNEKPVQERTLRVIAVAAGGFAALLLAAPDWARDGLVVFAAIYAVMVLALDENVRSWIPDHRRKSGVRDDTKRAGEKSPASRRAAT
jgi:hypothetical protein